MHPTTIPTASPHEQALAARLRGLSRLVRGLLLVGLPLLLLSPLWLWWHPGAFPLDGTDSLGLGDARLAAPAQLRLLGLTYFGLVFALGMAWQLWRLFGEYGQGRLFSDRAVQSLRRLGAWLLADWVAGPLIHAAASVARTWDNPPGQRMLTLSFGSTDYQQLLFALLVLALARVMQEAARAAAENEGFV